jgi:hypothetical protein
VLQLDIWGFGSAIYEMATGNPPNHKVSWNQIYDRMKKSGVPRLEGGNYSLSLRDLVAFCLEENPTDRPKVDDVLRHSYIANTVKKYPAGICRALVLRYRDWEAAGGQRVSLFQPHPHLAHDTVDPSQHPTSDTWDLDTVKPGHPLAQVQTIAEPAQPVKPNSKPGRDLLALFRDPDYIPPDDEYEAPRIEPRTSSRRPPSDLTFRNQDHAPGSPRNSQIIQIGELLNPALAPRPTPQFRLSDMDTIKTGKGKRSISSSDDDGRSEDEHVGPPPDPMQFRFPRAAAEPSSPDDVDIHADLLRLRLQAAQKNEAVGEAGETVHNPQLFQARHTPAEDDFVRPTLLRAGTAPVTSARADTAFPSFSDLHGDTEPIAEEYMDSPDLGSIEINHERQASSASYASSEYEIEINGMSRADSSSGFRGDDAIDHNLRDTISQRTVPSGMSHILRNSTNYGNTTDTVLAGSRKEAIEYLDSVGAVDYLQARVLNRFIDNGRDSETSFYDADELSAEDAEDIKGLTEAEGNNPFITRWMYDMIQVEKYSDMEDKYLEALKKCKEEGTARPDVMEYFREGAPPLPDRNLKQLTDLERQRFQLRSSNFVHFIQAFQAYHEAPKPASGDPEPTPPDLPGYLYIERLLNPIFEDERLQNFWKEEEWKQYKDPNGPFVQEAALFAEKNNWLAKAYWERQEYHDALIQWRAGKCEAPDHIRYKKSQQKPPSLFRLPAELEDLVRDLKIDEAERETNAARYEAALEQWRNTDGNVPIPSYAEYMESARWPSATKLAKSLKVERQELTADLLNKFGLPGDFPEYRGRDDDSDNSSLWDQTTDVGDHQRQLSSVRGRTTSKTRIPNMPAPPTADALTEGAPPALVEAELKRLLTGFIGAMNDIQIMLDSRPDLQKDRYKLISERRRKEKILRSDIRHEAQALEEQGVTGIWPAVKERINKEEFHGLDRFGDEFERDQYSQLDYDRMKVMTPPLEEGRFPRKTSA